MANAVNLKLRTGITLGVTTGTPPIVTSSTTLVTNLNADLLDGEQGPDFHALSNATGTLAIANGGTGQTTANTALNALLPSQTGNNTKVLTTDGTNTSWTTASGGGATLSDDTTTNASRYLAFADATSGSWTTAYVSSTKLYFNPSTGTLNATTFNSLSDEQFKTNIRPIENALDVVNSIDGVSFDWIETGHHSYGVIAQELEKVIPSIVHESENGFRSVEYNAIIGFLIEAVKELSARVETLEKM